jgi:protein-S-isoprenylcysteine O-methyltransferase Ste14
MSSTETRDHPGLMVPPPLFVLIAVALAFVLEWLVPVVFLPAVSLQNPLTWAGAIIAIGGVALTVRGAREFQRAGTNVNPFQPALKIVSSGPYRFTRNPMYLGMIVFMLGFSLLLSLEWGLILTPVLWFAFDRLIVAREEAYLSRKFGQPYSDLLTRTRRWL